MISHAADDVVSGLMVTAVSKQFGENKNRVDVLHDVTLTVAKGEFLTVIGPSGCGKSTFLRILAGLLEPDQGSVSIFGESPMLASSAKRIGFVPQAPALLPWRTVLENVRLPLQINKKSRTKPASASNPMAILESFGLGQVMNHYPAQISGGMQQRVAIARAFVFEPSLLLMDEPFAALDELNREMQRHKLLKFWESNQKTVVFVTHSVAEAVSMSDRIVVLSSQPGRVRAVVDVDLPRPRTQTVESTSEFLALTERVRSELRRAFQGLDD